MSDDDTPQFDPEELGTRPMTRRGLLAAAGVGGLAAACGPRGRPGERRRLPAALLAHARRHRHARLVRRERRDSGLARGHEAVHQAKTGINVKTNTFAHGPFQEHINNYLQGRPDDVFTWFAGYRMQFFAAKGLATPIDDVWKTLTPQMPPAFKAASTGADGHQYFVPEQELSVGRVLPEEPLEGEGLHRPQDVGPVHRARQEDAGGRADADRVHGQGRLAPDGHLRHHQHADQRLQVPRRPDGREAGVGRPAGEGRLQEVDRALPLLLRGRARPHVAGRRGRSSRTSRPACSSSAGSSPGRCSRRTRRTSTSSRSPRSTRSGGRTRSTPRSTAT